MSQRYGWRVASSTACMILETHMNLATEEGAGSQHNARSEERQPCLRNHPFNFVGYHYQIIDSLLKNSEVGLVLQNAADSGLVDHTISLGTSRTYSRTLAGVKSAELDTGFIGCPCHGSAKCIDFSQEMGLAYAADRRVTGHLAKSFDTMSDQQGSCAHTRRRKSGFSAGVTTTNDDDIKLVLKGHRRHLWEKGWRIIRVLFLLRFFGCKLL